MVNLTIGGGNFKGISYVGAFLLPLIKPIIPCPRPTPVDKAAGASCKARGSAITIKILNTIQI